MFYKAAYMIYYNGSCNYKCSQLTEKAQLCKSEYLIQHVAASLWDGKKMSSPAWEQHHFRGGVATSACMGKQSGPRQGMETASKLLWTGEHHHCSQGCWPRQYCLQAGVTVALLRFLLRRSGDPKKQGSFPQMGSTTWVYSITVSYLWKPGSGSA